jgi:hypothetical protein
MDEKPTDSAAIQSLRLTWNGVTGKSDYSWRTLNSCMHDSLALAIRSHLQFNQDDFHKISSEFRWDYWNGGGGEGFYNLAVFNKNTSAIEALEHYWNRRPFRAYRVLNTTGSYMQSAGNIQRYGRLVVGSVFFWIGQRVTVTSFNDKEHKVIAVIYRKPEAPEKREVLDRITEHEHGTRSPIEKIYRISNEELKGK